MKKMLVVMMVLTAGLVSVAAPVNNANSAANAVKISLADARSKIDQVIANPDQMKVVVESLSAEDQVAYLADVNKAIADMPGSEAEKTAKFLDINRAALAGAAKGNAAALTAEMFATVPTEPLTVLSEALAADIFNRQGKSGQTYSMADYTKLAEKLMGVINERCESTDNGSPRAALAIVMLVRGSSGTAEEQAALTDALINTMKHDDAKEAARKEWIPEALGKDGIPQSYEQILAAANAGMRPDLDAVLAVSSGIEVHNAVLADILGKFTDPTTTNVSETPVLDAVMNKTTALHQGMINAELPGAAGAAGGAGGVPQAPGDGSSKPVPPTPVPPEPMPYNGQWQ